MKEMKKFVWLMMIEVCINFIEIRMAGFLGNILFTSAHMCIFVCIVL